MNLPKHLTRGGINEAAGERNVNDSAVQIARILIANHVTPRQYFNTKNTSYHLKHVCERLGGCYIANGDFIAAMILEGYDWKERCSGSPNTYFRADFRKLKALDRRIKRNGVPIVHSDCNECLVGQTIHP